MPVFIAGRLASIPQEPLPEPTAAEIAREAEQEAAVFAQAANVDRLLMMLRNMDPAKDNLADNEEIQVCTSDPPMRMHDTYPICTGIVPVLHDIAPQDCETN